MIKYNFILDFLYYHRRESLVGKSRFSICQIPLENEGDFSENVA